MKEKLRENCVSKFLLEFRSDNMKMTSDPAKPIIGQLDRTYSVRLINEK